MASSKVSNLATARKMAKKGGQTSLQVDVNTDDEWQSLLQRPGLIVVDVYSKWCGPCVAMMSNLKKIKLESGVDQFHLALACADTIKVLNRFQGRSEPTWMIIGSGRLMRVLFGSNAPLLAKTIQKELDREVKCMTGHLERRGMPFDEITPDEREKMTEMEAKKAQESERERKELDEAMDKVKRRNYERLARVMNMQTVVVFFPPTIIDPEEQYGKRICGLSYKLMSMYDTIGLSIVDQLDVTLNRDEIAEMMYNSGIVLPEELLKTIDARACIVSLIQEANATEARPSRSISVASGPGSLDYVEKKMATLIYGEKMDPLQPSPESIVKKFEVDLNGVKVPPCWTPLEHISKAAAVNVCFPTKVESSNVPMDALPPPSYIIIFDAKRAREILDAAKPFAEDVLHVGYFDSTDPDKASKVANTIYELEKLGEGKVNDSKMVIALKKTTSDPMLILAQMNAIYISSDLQTGTAEMEKFFPPMIEPYDEPDPWGPPPHESKVYWTDEEDNVWVEENKVAYNGDIIRGRRLVRLADGTEVEEGEWREIPSDEPEAPTETEIEVEAEDGEGDDDIGLLYDGYGPIRKMNLGLDTDEDTIAPTSRHESIQEERKEGSKEKEEKKEEKDEKKDQKDVKKDQKDVKKDQKDVKKDQKDVKKDQKDVKKDQKDVKKDEKKDKK